MTWVCINVSKTVQKEMIFYWFCICFCVGVDPVVELPLCMGSWALSTPMLSSWKSMWTSVRYVCVNNKKDKFREEYEETTNMCRERINMCIMYQIKRYTANMCRQWEQLTHVCNERITRKIKRYTTIMSGEKERTNMWRERNVEKERERGEGETVNT